MNLCKKCGEIFFVTTFTAITAFLTKILRTHRISYKNSPHSPHFLQKFTQKTDPGLNIWIKIFKDDPVTLTVVSDEQWNWSQSLTKPTSEITQSGRSTKPTCTINQSGRSKTVSEKRSFTSDLPGFVYQIDRSKIYIVCSTFHKTNVTSQLDNEMQSFLSQW